MIRYLLAGVAALALTTGVAFAQDSYSESTTTTVTQPASPPVVAPAPLPPPTPLVTPPPPDAVGPSYDQETNSTTYDSNGVQTERRQSYQQRQQSFYDGNGQLGADTTTTQREWRSSVAAAPLPPPVPLVQPVPAPIQVPGQTRIYVPPGGTAVTHVYPDGTTSTTVTSPY